MSFPKFKKGDYVVINPKHKRLPEWTYFEGIATITCEHKNSNTFDYQVYGRDKVGQTRVISFSKEALIHADKPDVLHGMMTNSLPENDLS